MSTGNGKLNGNGKHPGGRPTAYKPEYCQKIIDFFADFKLEKENPHYPTITDFAKKIGVNRISIRTWAEVHPEFSAALKEAKDLQQEIIIRGAITGIYNASFSIFAMKNVAGWRDRSEVEHSGNFTFTQLLKAADPNRIAVNQN